MKNTQAGHLMGIAYAAYQRGEPEIAQQICVLALADDSAEETFDNGTGDGNGNGAEDSSEHISELKEQLAASVNEGDYARAQSIAAKLKILAEDSEDEDLDVDLDDGVDDLDELEGEYGLPTVGEDDELLEEDDDLGEGTLSPGDEVPAPPAPEVSQATAARLVVLARKIKAGGHEDLAQLITRGLLG